MLQLAFSNSLQQTRILVQTIFDVLKKIVEYDGELNPQGIKLRYD